MHKRSKKGYVLAVVMIFAFLLAATMTTTFAIVYRYQYKARKTMEELRQKVNSDTSDATAYLGEDFAQQNNGCYTIEM